MLQTGNFPDILHSMKFTLWQILPNAKAALPLHQGTWNRIFCLYNLRLNMTYKMKDLEFFQTGHN